MTYVPARAIGEGVTDQRSRPVFNSGISAPTAPLQLLEGMPFDGEDFRKPDMSAAGKNLLGAVKFLAISASLGALSSDRLGLPGSISKPLRLGAVGYALVGVVDILGEIQDYAKGLGSDLEGLIRESEDDWYA
jgi:hypothetical protein